MGVGDVEEVTHFISNDRHQRASILHANTLSHVEQRYDEFSRKECSIATGRRGEGKV